MAFADVFAGYQEAAGQHYNNLLQMDYANKQRLAQQYSQLADDPRYAPEQQQEFQRRALMIPTMQPMQKTPKDWENMMISVAPRPAGPGVSGQAGAPGALGGLTPPTAPPVPGGEAGPSGQVPGAPQFPLQLGPSQAPTPELAAMGGQLPSVQTPVMQQLPYEEQLRRAQAQAIAKGAPSILDTMIKAMKGDKIGQYPTVDPQTGQAYQMIRWRGLKGDPIAALSGDISGFQPYEYETRSELPMRPFAPRAVSTAGLTAEDALYAAQNDVPLQFSHMPTQAEMAKVYQYLPNAQIIPTGFGQYYVAGQHWSKTVVANGHTYLYPNLPSAQAEPFHKYVDAGVASSGLERVTQPSVRGVRGGELVATPSVVTPRVPGGTVPGPQMKTIPQQIQSLPQTPPVPSAIPGAPIPSLEKPPITEDVILNLSQQFPNDTRTSLIQGLVNSGWSTITGLGQGYTSQRGSTGAPVSVPQRQPTEEEIRQFQQANPRYRNDRPGAIQSLMAGGIGQPSGPGGVAAAPVPPQTAPVTPPAAPPQREPIYQPALYNHELDIMRSLTPATEMMVGSPQNPMFESLESFGRMMDDPLSRQRVGAAFRTILEGLTRVDQKNVAASLGVLGTGISLGNLTGIAANYLGIPAAQAQSETTAMENALKDLNPREKRWLGRLIASYGTIVGYRKITSQGAYQFSTQAMEREVPVPGMAGGNDSRSYYNQLASLLAEPSADMEYMKTDAVSPETKQFYRDAATRLTMKGRADLQKTDKDTGKSYYRVDGRWYGEDGKPYAPAAR
jgi:hypothetical protein